MQKKILVLGDIMLDKYLEGTVSRISPEAPVPVVNIKKEYLHAGGAANVAHNCLTMGAEVVLVGVTGNDAHGKLLLELLAALGIAQQCIAENCTTTTKIRIVGNHQQITRIDYDGRHNYDAKIMAACGGITDAGTVVISDYKKGVCTPAVCHFLIDRAKQTGQRVIVDPKISDWAQYAGAFMLTPNFKEFAAAAGADINDYDDDVAQYGAAVRQRYQLEHLLVTRSEKGMSLISATGCTHFSSHAVEVFDVSGAGDTVVAAIAAALAAGYDVNDAVSRANIAAGIAVAHPGTYAVKQQELNAAFALHEKQ